MFVGGEDCGKFGSDASGGDSDAGPDGAGGGDSDAGPDGAGGGDSDAGQDGAGDSESGTEQAPHVFNFKGSAPDPFNRFGEFGAYPSWESSNELWIRMLWSS